MNRDSSGTIKSGKRPTCILRFVFDKYATINGCLKKALFNRAGIILKIFQFKF